MSTLRTGKRYEIVFGPGLDPTSLVDASVVDGTFRTVCDSDSDAIILSAASDGLKVIGSDLRAAIEAGRETCSIFCRVFDRDTSNEMSNALELARRPAAPSWVAPVAQYDPRSAHSAPGSRKSFKMPARTQGGRR